jgi:hypothetical protein
MRTCVTGIFITFVRRKLLAVQGLPRNPNVLPIMILSMVCAVVALEQLQTCSGATLLVGFV